MQTCARNVRQRLLEDVSSRLAIRMERRTCVACAALLLTGCAPRPVAAPFGPKPSQPTFSVRYCFDHIGHEPKAVPLAMGGTCCCTPSDDSIRRLHSDGLCLDMNADDLQSRYEAKGFVTARNAGHAACNNCCDHGPHVVFGGRCMSPPVPGTQNYEDVAAGRRAASPAPSKAQAGKR